MATSYQRCGGLTDSGSSPLAAPEDGGVTSRGIVVRVEGLRRLAGGNGQARRAEVDEEAGGNPCLPDIRSRADDDHQPAGTHAGAAQSGGRHGGSQAHERIEESLRILVAVRRPTA